jgi:hypothetical protein
MRTHLFTLSFAIAAVFTFAMQPVVTHGSNVQAADTFLIGVFLQPISTTQHADNFQYWKNLGVNTLVLAAAESKDITTWDAVAQAHSLATIREPSGNYQYDIRQYQAGNLLALSLEDEPDKYAGNYSMQTAQVLINKAQNIRNQAPGVPIYATFATYPSYGYDAWFSQVYTKGVDMIGYDKYPINSGYPISDLNPAAQKITAVSGRAPILFIETGDIGIQYSAAYQQAQFNALRAHIRTPTPAEIRIEMAQAVANGARGFVFFPQHVYGGVFIQDNTPPENAAMIRTETALWSGLTNDPGTAISGLPSGVIGHRRLLNGSYVKIIANTNPFSINVGNQTFAGYEYKILNDNDQSIRVSNTFSNTTAFIATCRVNSNSVNIQNAVFWTADVSGGEMPYTYSWSSLDGVVNANSLSNISATYANSGTKHMSVTVTSHDGQQKTVQCPNVEVTETPLVISCGMQVFPGTASTTNIVWTSKATGGLGSYEISWTGTDSLYSSSTSVQKMYSTGGTKVAQLYVVSGDQSKNLTCLALLPDHVISNQVYGSCDATLQGLDIAWSARGTLGDGHYTYLWNSFTGTTSINTFTTFHYDIAGEKTALVTISDTTSHLGLQCAAVAVSQPVTTSNCFIATAAYGTPMQPEVQALRDFRDNYLMTNILGRGFVKTYYAVSPTIANIIRNNNSLKALTRSMLEPVIDVVKKIE